MLRTVILLIIALNFTKPVFAQKSSDIQDRIIGSAFKTLAKAFVAVTDINKLKEDNARKIINMDEDKFRKRYAKVYEVIGNLPARIKSVYGIREVMSREEAARSIKILDKNKAYEIIDVIPDKMIADQFRQYLQKKKQDIKNSNLAEQINQFWNKVTGKFKKSR